MYMGNEFPVRLVMKEKEMIRGEWKTERERERRWGEANPNRANLAHNPEQCDLCSVLC